jgi:hypothetical protein
MGSLQRFLRTTTVEITRKYPLVVVLLAMANLIALLGATFGALHGF